jgi:hypothetical protein
MDLKLPITLNDELEDMVLTSTGMLDMASGDILDVKRVMKPGEPEGLPAEREDYEFTCGVLTNGKADIEFRVEVNVITGAYSVTPTELLELKGRAAKLFTAPPPGKTRA